MKTLTIRQPYAGAVALGWKPIENRPRNVQHRGPILIHAGANLAPPAAFDLVPKLAGQELPMLGSPKASPAWAMGAIIAAAELEDVHHARDCDLMCSPWSEPGAYHYEIARPQVLRRPVAALGSLWLWTPDDFALSRVQEQLA